MKLLLAEPNPDDPLMPDIAAEFRERREEYERRAKMVSETGSIPELSEPGDENEAPRREGKSLLKRRAPTAKPEPVESPIDAQTAESPVDEPSCIILESMTTLPVPVAEVPTTQFVVIDFDDDFEAPVPRAKKPSMLSSKRPPS